MSKQTEFEKFFIWQLFTEEFTILFASWQEGICKKSMLEQNPESKEYQKT